MTKPTRADTPEGERGAAVAESAMIMALLAILFAAIMQFGVVIYTYNAMVDAASAGARHASLADRSAQDGAERAKSLMTSAVPRSQDLDVSTSISSGDGGAEMVTVIVRHQLPMVGFISGPVILEATGHAYRYQ
ncbi:TadE/TadG family type IV pilus assembly protein [Citricoccus sp. NR2]|uniref:TadE/TadG family type IV pilus assembly protein n=1 Tax=Citricoccus sp. NR2 TaxID=3004095 RepID=UPI0022DE8408|nr:TadE family protein [Citricoccus sp. NR2]WBL18679.1 pilus assembly protein [Citricoccus sp. NR2]